MDTDSDFRHTLVIGGTGMLAAATRRLARRSSLLTLVARRPDRLGELDVEVVERVAVDYHRTDVLIERLEQATARHGEFDMALTWVHSSADASLCRVAEFLSGQAEVARLVDVRGSAAARPDVKTDRQEFVGRLDGLAYQRVVLGFVTTDGSSRWLTHDEISNGVIEALDSCVQERVVGVVEPWDARPRGA